MSVTRRTFLSLSASACALPSVGWADESAPLLKLGVLADVHIGGRTEAPARLEFALRWLEARGVEAVLFPGDIAHTGRIQQMEKFAAVWYKVFPNGRASDGRRVEIMISTGNHDAWTMGLDRQTEEKRKSDWLMYGDNMARTWDRLFGEPWAPVWRKEVKGLTFIGAQWPTLKPDLGGFMKAHAKTFDPSKPFFHCQHEHPQGTCHGTYGCGFDRGQSVRALSPFANAVAFSGHSHCSIADERAVWQGAFTSIGAGCVHEGGLAFTHDNCSAFWHPTCRTHLMGPLNDAKQAWGGDPDGGCFLFVDVFADHLTVHRRSSVHDLPIGPDWIVPIPSRRNGPFEFTRRATERAAPEFAADAVVTAEICPKGHPLEGPAFKGVPCVHLAFPNAKPVRGARVFDYLVAAQVDGKTVKELKLFASGFSNPPERSDLVTHGLFALSDLPAGRNVVFAVTPRECFGRAGRPRTSSALILPA